MAKILAVGRSGIATYNEGCWIEHPSTKLYYVYKFYIYINEISDFAASWESGWFLKSHYEKDTY